jgi:predicted ATPase
MSDEYYPSGDHVPYVLARLLLQGETGKGRKVHDALVTFGIDSGLFRGINVKRLGNKAGDPFQVQVTVGGPSVNLSDVGYGVSQSLPIIVESILRATNARILLQQPEVHLHPRAQAALGSFFSKLVAHEHRQFVIETHSDYLIDRVRQEVASGTLAPESVSILFFDRPHIETTVSELTLDKHGNIENAPENYRTFFLEEELRLLSRAEGE